MAWVITIDIGTTAMKVGLFDETLICLALETREYDLLHPKTGWMELPAAVYIEEMTSGIQALMMQFPEAANQVEAVCLTSQGETLLFVDENDCPLYPAIVWLDNRATVEAEELTTLFDNDAFYRTTGLPENNPSMPASKVRWFANNYPDRFQKTRKVLLLVDWLALYLSGNTVSDEAIQTSTGWFNIHTRDLWADMIQAIGLRENQLPEVLPCGSSAGTLLPQVATLLHLKPDAQVVLCGMDQVSSAIGGGNFSPGIVCETTGTALVLSATIDKADFDRLERITFLAHVHGQYLMLPYCPTAGMLLKWFRREFGDVEERLSRETGASVYALMDALAETGIGYEKGLFLLPDFEGKLTPVPNPDACGVLYGITLGTTRADMVRAILESVGFMLRENVAMLEAYGVQVNVVRSLGGGAKSMLWGKIKADILQKPVSPQSFSESTSLGAAMLGQVAMGTFPNLAAAFAAIPVSENPIIPDKQKTAAVNMAFEKYQRIYMAMESIL